MSKGKLAYKRSQNIISVEVFPHLDVSNEQINSAYPPPTAREMREGHLTKRNRTVNYE